MPSRMKARTHGLAGSPPPIRSLGGNGATFAAAPLGGQAGCRGEQGSSMDAPPPVLRPEGLGAPLPTTVSTLKTVPPAFLFLLHHHHSENTLLCALQDFPSWGPPAPTPPQGCGGLVAASGNFHF